MTRCDPQALIVAVAECIGDAETVDDIRCTAHQIAHKVNQRTDLHAEPEDVRRVAGDVVRFKTGVV